MRTVTITAMGFGLLVLGLTGCMTTTDRGIYNPAGNADVTLAQMTIEKNISVRKVNGTEVNWKNDGFLASMFSLNGRVEQTVELTPGLHVFSLDYDDGQVYTRGTTDLTVLLAEGKKYRVTGTKNIFTVDFDIIDEETGKSVAINLQGLRGSKSSPVASFIKYVLNPTMDGVEKTVILENNDYRLSFDPDLNYTLLNQTTKVETRGKRGFQTDLGITEGTVYLLETDPSLMSRDQFLQESDYEHTAQMVWKVMYSDEKTVRFSVVRPVEQKGQELLFTIRVTD